MAGKSKHEIALEEAVEDAERQLEHERQELFEQQKTVAEAQGKLDLLKSIMGKADAMRQEFDAAEDAE